MNVIYITGESYLDHSYTIAKELGKHVKLKIYFTAREQNEETRKWLAEFNAEYVKRGRFRNILSFFKEFWFILKLRKQKADCIWFDTMTIYQVWPVKLLLKNYIVMVHDIEIHPETGDKHGRLSVKLTLKHHLLQTAVASRTQAAEFKKRYGFEPKVFLLPAIDYYHHVTNNPVSNAGNDHVGNAARPGEKSGKLRFFFFGTVEKYKGLETLLEAAEILDSGNAEYELNIYGRLKYDRENFRSTVSRLKNVNLTDKFIDYREVHSIYSDNDVIILPYRQVTQCGPLLIGYSVNTPAICSDLPGFREYVDDGSSGLIFNNTARGLADKMEQLIKNPLKVKEMKNYTGTAVQDKFSMRALADEYVKNLKI